MSHKHNWQDDPQNNQRVCFGCGVKELYDTKFVCSIPDGVKVLSMCNTPQGIVLSTNKGGYIVDKKTHELRKLEAR